MPSTNSRTNPSSNKTTAIKHKNELCPNRLDTGHSTNAKVPTIKIIKEKKLSIDTGMASNLSDSNENTNWHSVTSPTKRINSPGASPNPKISNNQNIFSTPNRYSSLSVEDNKNNSNSIVTEMENDDIIIKAPPSIFIKSIINNYQQFCEAIKSLHTPPMEFSCKTTQSLSLGPLDWKLFQQRLDESLSLNFPLKCPLDIDNAISILTKSIQNAVSNSSSLNSNNILPKNHTSLPPFLVNLIKAKRQARSLWQRTKYPSHKTIYNHPVTHLKTQLSKFRSEQFSKYLITLTPKNGSLWKTTKILINHRDNIPPLERPDKSLAISDLEKANLFGNHLSCIFSPRPDLNSTPDHTNRVNSFLSSPLPMSLTAVSK
ncbi:hypothetical protein ACI65C_001531 [Semiaphis heraclei]